LFARVDQMKRCYKVPIEEFFERGYSWATRSTTINYKRPLFMDETVTVRTWIKEIKRMKVEVGFQFLKSSGDTAAEGHSVFFLLDTKKEKPVAIPEDIIQKYSI
jgi:acyl-CoA thioesterase FadM